MNQNSFPGKKSTSTPISLEMSDELREVLNIVAVNSGIFRNDFHTWIKSNFAIWETFVFEADRIWARGRLHYSARTLIEYIRHHTFIRESNSNFKVNNNFVPDIARLYGFVFPERIDLFELRTISGAHHTQIRTAFTLPSISSPAPATSLAPGQGQAPAPSPDLSASPDQTPAPTSPLAAPMPNVASDEDTSLPPAPAPVAV